MAKFFSLKKVKDRDQLDQLDQFVESNSKCKVSKSD